jgi:uncharacterized membrane protein
MDTMSPWRVRLVVGLLVALFAVVYSLEGVVRHWQFGSSFDLAIYDQAVWHFSRFETPSSSVRGYANIFGDHFHPVLMLFAPLYWVWPSASALLVAQGCLFALSIVPVFAFARSRVAAGPASMIAAAYGFFWGLQQAAAFDVHEFAFAPLFVALAILAMDRRRWPLFWCTMAALALTKEDLLPLVAWFGAFLWWQGERRRGAALAIAGLASFLLVVGLVIPHMAGLDGFGYTSAYGDVIRRPWTIPAVLATPPKKLFTASMWVAPFALLPLASPITLLLVPLAFVRFLSSSPLHWGTAFHYSAPIAPIVAMAAADGLARLLRKVSDPNVRGRLAAAAGVACVVLAASLPGHQRHWRVFSPKFYAAVPQRAGANAALRLISPDGSVVAQAAVLPHLSQRQQAFVLQPGAPDADFVVATRGLSAWPLADDAAIARLLEERRARGYQVIHDRDGWTVLARPRAAGQD